MRQQTLRSADRHFHYPGWEAALRWFHHPKQINRSGRYWLTPRHVYRKLNGEFRFDFDPCPYPLPKGFNALTMEWGKCNYVNPPFRKGDSGTGVTAFIRKAIDEQRKGKTSVLVLPIYDYINLLLEAGAEVRALGRVPFQDIASKEAAPHPAAVALFVLRGTKRRRAANTN